MGLESGDLEERVELPVDFALGSVMVTFKEGVDPTQIEAALADYTHGKLCDLPSQSDVANRLNRTYAVHRLSQEDARTLRHTLEQAEPP